jgi:AcrR family transcriptional regulator
MNESRERQILEDFERRLLGQSGVQAADVTDGRVANRLLNRDKVIDSLIELVREGKKGTVDEIVERSGIARRSIFRYFTDLSDMLLEAFRRVVRDAAPLAMLPSLGVGSLENRIEAFIEARLRGLQMTYPFAVMARVRLSESEVLSKGLAATTEMVRVQIANQFASELVDRSAPETERLVDAIYVMVCFEGFGVLVDQLARPIETVRAMWIDNIRMLLAGSPGTITT